MAAPTQTPRRRWIEEGLRVLGAGGPDAVRIEPLAKELGVTRGGFYWHFDDRAALLGEMLDEWERSTTNAVIARVERKGGDARAKLRHAFALLTSSEQGLAVDLAVRDWSRRDPAVAERLRGVDDRRMAWLRSQYATFCDDPDEVEARSLLSFSLLIGNHFIAAGHGARTRAEVLEASLRLLGAQH